MSSVKTFVFHFEDNETQTDTTLQWCSDKNISDKVLKTLEWFCIDNINLCPHYDTNECHKMLTRNIKYHGQYCQGVFGYGNTIVVTLTMTQQALEYVLNYYTVVLGVDIF